MILDSKHINYDVIDITEPGREADKDFMQNNAKSNGGTVSDPNPRSPLPPQVFNDDDYCGVCIFTTFFIYLKNKNKLEHYIGNEMTYFFMSMLSLALCLLFALLQHGLKPIFVL